MQVDLSGRVAVVSGGSSGMGAAISERLAGSGAAVVVGGRNLDRTVAVVDAITAAGGRAVAGLGDVANSAEAAALIDVGVESFGGVDLVINAAGVIHRADAMGTSDDDWARVMSINVDGTFFLSRAAIPALRARGGGVIVNQSSMAAVVTALHAHEPISDELMLASTVEYESESGQWFVEAYQLAVAEALRAAGLRVAETLRRSGISAPE